MPPKERQEIIDDLRLIIHKATVTVPNMAAVNNTNKRSDI